MKSDKLFQIPGYHLIPRHRNARWDLKKGGGVAIYVDQDIQFTTKLINDIEGISIEIAEIKIYNVYIPNKGIKFKKFQSIFNEADIIVGDFNAHHPIWGGSIITTHGRQIFQKIHENDYECLNDGSPTYFEANGYRTSIDLTFIKANLNKNVKWTNTLQRCGSNHTIILTQIGQINYQPQNKIPYWNLHKADWLNFAAKASTFINSSIISPDVNEFHNNLINNINKAAELTIPKKLPNSVTKYKPWWNQDCLSAIKQRNKAFNKVSKTHQPQDYIIYKKLKAKAEYTIKQAKTNYWEQTCNNLNDTNNTKNLWNKINQVNNVNKNKPIPTLIENQTKIKDPQILADTFAQKFAKDYSIENIPPNKLEIRNKFIQRFNKDIEEAKIKKGASINDPIKFQELKEAIREGKNTVPGQDQIGLIFYQKLPDDVLQIILNLFNLIWKSGQLPNQWKEAIIIPILKPNKDPTSNLSYRPIALTSTLCKLMERIINKRLVWFLNSEHKFNRYQSGFMKNRCTTDHIIRLMEDIYNAFDCNGCTIGIFY